MKRWCIVIICILISLASVFSIVGAKKGMFDFLEDLKVVKAPEGYVRNPDNLITPDTYLDISGPTGCGFSVAVNDDGVISLNGSKVVTKTTIKVADFEISAGTYMFSANDYYDVNGYVMKIRKLDSNGNPTEDSPFAPIQTSSCTFTVEETTRVGLYIYTTAGWELDDYNRHFYPVLVEGEERAEFYVSAASVEN